MKTSAHNPSTLRLYGSPRTPQIITARKRAAKLDLLEGTKADGMETHSATGGSSQGGGRRSRRREANDDSADSVASFSVRHRQQTLEMLLSRERVLSLLYTKVNNLYS